MADAKARMVPPDLEVFEELGRGTQAVVYRARRSGADYALKVRRPRTAGANGVADLCREAAMLTRVVHPGLAAVHAVGESADGPYLVMEFVRGTTLSQLLERGPLDEAQAATIGLDVAGALGAAHSFGMVHRDVTPHNIMVGPDGHAKLIDFGLAARVGDTSEAVAGTFAYVAPEQAGMLSRLVDGRADLYALGVVLFRCVTGQLPFTSPDIGELLRMHAVVPAPDPRSVRPGISASFAAVMEKLLAKDPDDRYQTGDGLIADLELLRDGAGGDPATGFVVGLRDAVARRPEHALIGRNGELTKLAERWRQARTGDGAVCLVRGAAGVGKTRLVAGLAASAASDGGVILHAVSRADDAVPLAPLRQAVDQYLRELERLPEPHRSEGFERVRAAVRPTASLLRPFSPALAVVIGEVQDPGEESKDQFILAVATFLLELARRSPAGLLLHLDDAQHLDVDTRGVLHHLVSQLIGTPMLVVAAVRDDLTGPDEAADLGLDLGDRAVHRLDLAALGDAAMRRLVAAQLSGATVPDALTTQITTRSAGNPLMAAEYLRTLIDAGLIRPFWGTWVLDESGLGALNLPANALDVVVARVRGLDQDSRQVLAVAAVVGSRFDPAHVALAGDFDQQRMVEALAAATDRRLIGAHDHGQLIFLHDRIREALLSDLDPARLRQLHQRIATVLAAVASDEPEHTYAVARHYSLGETAEDPAATFGACVAAGRLALTQYARDQALDFLLTADAVATTAGLARDAEFLGILGTAYVNTGRFSQALPCLERAIAAEPDPLRRAAHHRQLAEAHRACWHVTETLAAARRGLAELGRPLPRNRMVLVVSTMFWVVAAVFVRTSGLGFGTATGPRRERYRLECLLLNQAAQGTTMRPDMLLIVCLGLRQMYPANRLGPSAEYVRSQSYLASAVMIAKGDRRSAPMYDRVRRVAEELGDPRQIQRIRWEHLVVGCGVRDPSRANADAMRRLIDEDGLWLTADDYLSSMAVTCGILVALGYAGEVLDWFPRARGRIATDVETTGAPVALSTIIPKAMTGQVDEARQQLQLVRDFIADNKDDWQQWVQYLLTALATAVELDELGEPFEEAVADLEMMGITPRRAWPTQCILWVWLAYGRIGQCRTATAQQLPARLVVAKRAVDRVGSLPGKLPWYPAHHAVLRAMYQHVAGDDNAALRLAADAELVSHELESPLLDYEIARVRARALRGLGHSDQARRYASSALMVAADQGWEHRARWIRTEFGLGEISHHGASTGEGSLPSATVVIERFRRRLDAIQQVSLAAAKVIDPQQLTRVALDETIRIFGAERAFLWLTDEASGQLRPSLGRDSSGGDLTELTGYSTTLVERVREGADSLVFTADSAGHSVSSESAVAHGLRSVMVAPVRLKDRLLGVVYLDSRVAKGIFTEGDADILIAITNHVAVSLETARAAQLQAAVRAAQQQRDLAETMRSATSELSSTLDPDQVLHRMLHAVTRALHADSACLLTSENGDLTVTVTSGESPEDAIGKQIDPATDAVLTRVMAASGPVSGGQVTGDPVPLPELLPGAASWIVLPLATVDARVGVMLIGSKQPDAYTGAHSDIVATLGGQAMIAYDKAGLFQRVRQLATQDGLTGVANRRHLLEQSEQRFASTDPARETFAAIMVDIDHFKKINDTHGHQVGDDVIREVADRLRQVIRAEDVIGRYGGEEFLLTLTADRTTVSQIAHRLHAIVGTDPVTTSRAPVAITVSIGVGYGQADDTDLASVIGRADRALYSAKEQGRNRVAAL